MMRWDPLAWWQRTPLCADTVPVLSTRTLIRELTHTRVQQRDSTCALGLIRRLFLIPMLHTTSRHAAHSSHGLPDSPQSALVTVRWITGTCWAPTVALVVGAVSRISIDVLHFKREMCAPHLSNSPCRWPLEEQRTCSLAVMDGTRLHTRLVWIVGQDGALGS